MKRLILLTFIAFRVLAAQEIRTTEQLVKAMHDRYVNKWYSTLTFVQKTTQYLPDSTTKIATWYEAFSFPGTMRIDIDSMGYGGMILSKDSLYAYREGNLATTRPFVHPLLLLGFDVYFLPVQEAITKLRGLHIDLTNLREDVWQGRPAFVVGAKQGDLHSAQFWIDKERLYFVRLLEPAGKDRSQMRETQFNKYERLDKGWLSVEVIFKVDGKVVTTEEYSEPRANPRLNPRLFDPQYWKSARWN
jgi:hypothetical protein